MSQLSNKIEKLESFLHKKVGKRLIKLKKYWLYILVGGYFYGMLINSIQLGIASTFLKEGQPPIESLWVFNPIKNLEAIFSPCGIGVTFVSTLMIILITKKGVSIGFLATNSSEILEALTFCPTVHMAQAVG